MDLTTWVGIACFLFGFFVGFFLLGLVAEAGKRGKEKGE